MDIQTAIRFARERHRGQQYATMPYTYHLAYCATVLDDFGFSDYVNQAIAWLHDVVEDTETTIDEIREEFGHEVADGVWACTGIGANRRECNADQATKLTILPRACIPKCGDRITNVENSIIDPGSQKPNLSMARMYLGEREIFGYVIRPNVPPEMYARLDRAYHALEEILREAAAA